MKAFGKRRWLLTALALVLSLATLPVAIQAQDERTTAEIINLNGFWIDHQNLPIKIVHFGDSVTATYVEPYACGGQSTTTDFTATLKGNKLTGETSTCYHDGFPPNVVYELRMAKMTLEVSVDGRTLSGSWRDWEGKGSTIMITRLCKAVDPNVTPTIQIDLAETLNIDESPEMPDITATARVTPSSTDVSWTAQITYKAPSGCSGGPKFDSPNVTGEGETFTPDFGAIYGGKLEITASTKCGTGAKTTITRDVGGVNAVATDVRNEIGAMEAPFEADDLKKIACQESRQQQFRAGNTPTFGPGGDAGIMQICYLRTVGDIWNWKTNIARGRAILLNAAGFSRGIPRTVRRRAVRGQGPFLDAADFTAEQLRLEAIKRYNAGNLPDVGYWEWDDAAGDWVANPQGGGEPNYVAGVTGQNANCP